MCPVHDTCFLFEGNSIHAHRYKLIALFYSELVGVMSSRWLDSFFLNAAQLVLQEEAASKQIPFFILNCEGSACIMGSHLAIKSDADAVDHLFELSRDVQQSERVLFIINMGNQHWVSVEIDLVDKVINCFDSMRSSLSRAGDATTGRFVLIAHTLFLLSRMPLRDCS